jgi:hypothetical protein
MNLAHKASFVVTLTGCAICFALLWSGARDACEAYYATPELRNFQALADPSTGLVVSKAWYFFSFFLFAFTGLILLLSISTKWLDARYGIHIWHKRYFRVVLGCLWTVMLLALIFANDQRARDAAARIGSHERGHPGRLLTEFCGIATAPPLLSTR